MHPLLHIAFYSTAFALIGYVGFNELVHKRKFNKLAWHIPETIIALALTWGLYSRFGLEAAGAFWLLHWCFVHDWLYYVWAAIFNPKNGWENRADAGSVIHSRAVMHSGWTMLGCADWLKWRIDIAVHSGASAWLGPDWPQPRRDYPSGLANLIQALLSIAFVAWRLW